MMSRTALLVAIGLALPGCDTLDRAFGAPLKTPLPGERRSMVRADERVQADPRLAGVEVSIPEARALDAWPQPGGTPQRALNNIAVAGIGVAWILPAQGSTATAGLRCRRRPPSACCASRSCRPGRRRRWARW